MKIDKDDILAWHYLGNAYMIMGRYRKAIEAFREDLRLVPDNDDAWNNIALCYAKSGNRSAALEAVNKLRRYDPQKADNVFNFIMNP